MPRVAAANIAPDGLIPQVDTACDAVVVGGDPHVSREIDGQVARVAAAQVQHIVVQERVDGLNRLQNVSVPFLLSVTMQRLVAGVLIVGLSVVERVLRQLQMWRKPSIRKHGAADAGPQRQDDLQATARNDAQTLDLCIVEQPRRALQTLRHGRFQRVSAPGLLAEVGRSHDMAAAHDTGESDGDPVEAR